jgi:signal transduction histidine kinase
VLCPPHYGLRAIRAGRDAVSASNLLAACMSNLDRVRLVPASAMSHRNRLGLAGEQSTFGPRWPVLMEPRGVVSKLDRTAKIGGEERLFIGRSELAAIMERFDWANTPIGSPEHWPTNLKTAVRIMLTSQQPIWIGWGGELTYLYNDPYKSIIGGKHPWALGRPASEVWHEIWDEISPLLAKAMGGEEGTYVEAQLLIMERNGFPEETHYTFSYSPIPNPDGSSGGIFCANTDDTQRVIGERQLSLLRELAISTAEARTVEEACRRSAQALSTNLRDLPFAIIYLVDAQDGLARLAASSGIEPGHPTVLAALPLTECELWPLAETLQTQRVSLVCNLHERFQADFPSGGWRRSPDRAIVAPILSSGEQAVIGFLIAGLNPFRLYDERYASFLELVARQIAAAVNNANAYEAERRRAEALAEIDRAKTTFFSNVSHEFRTPLTLMLSPLEDALARESERLPPEHLSTLALVHRNGVRLLKLVNTLLDFARIESGRVAASFQRVDLAALTADLASNFRSATDRAGLQLTVAVAPLPEEVYVDRDMWEKIVLNLLSNAFKFTFEGEIGVVVRPSADGAQAEVLVRDTGTGIPARELPHLFERFRRVEGARGRSFEGSGIGLALVQELVKLHGGSIAVSSELERGTTFSIKLPFGSAHLPTDRLNAPSAQAVTSQRAKAYLDEAIGWLEGHAALDRPDASSPEDVGSPPIASTPARKGRILLADDNADMRRYIGRLLSDHYDVEAVGDGEYALQAALRQRPDLILSDVMMPRLDGFGLLKALRLHRELSDIPVIFLSARAGEEAKVEGLRHGADDYLIKPFSARELFARVEANIELSVARSEQARLLQTLNTTLEQRVADEVRERTKAEEQLRQVQKMEAVGQLTGGIAHDFNNMLAVIIGGLNLLQRRLAKGELDVQRFVEGAIDAAQRAASLTQRLLAFSRQQPLALEPVNANKLIAGMADLLSRTLGEQIAIETVLSAGLWQAKADLLQLENAILNLCVNARDAMPNGGRLTIETSNAYVDHVVAKEYAIPSGQYVLIAVADDGVGMSADIAARAFDPFFTTKGVGKGTGLGLSQVYGFVRQSGGHVKIYSEIGLGTTLKIYLPRYTGDAASIPARVVSNAPRRGSRGEVVLVVEDEARVRTVSVEALRDLGYTAIGAADANEALHLLDGGLSISLLFTDVIMPVMSGRELAERIRQKSASMKVLYTTGYTRNAIVHNGILEPGTSLLTKPFSIEELAVKVREALDS